MQRRGGRGGGNGAVCEGCTWDGDRSESNAAAAQQGAHAVGDTGVRRKASSEASEGESISECAINNGLA